MNQNEQIIRESGEIPGPIKDVIKGLDSDARLAIIVSLMKKGKMTFTELKGSLNISQSSLSSDLSLLQDGGLVSNILEWNKKSYSYYTITALAKSILESLFDIVLRAPDYEHKESKEYFKDFKLLTVNEHELHDSLANKMLAVYRILGNVNFPILEETDSGALKFNFKQLPEYEYKRKIPLEVTTSGT